MKNRTKCILLIDDNDADNEYHSIVINRLGLDLEVHITDSGEEALAFLKDDNQIAPHLIFLDINMPRMDGWEFLEKFKTLGGDKKYIPVVILSTSLYEPDVERAKKIVEVKGFREKPLTRQMLTEIMKEHLDKTDTSIVR